LDRIPQIEDNKKAMLTNTKAHNLKPDDKHIPHGGVTGLTLISSGTKGHGKWVQRFVSPALASGAMQGSAAT
jgi:hypothetical protein